MHYPGRNAASPAMERLDDTRKLVDGTKGENNMSLSDDYCFACGKENPIGLKLDFSLQDGKYVARKALAKEYQGYDGIAHGGILTTMLDEAMAGYLNKELGEKAVTARLDVRYRKPVPIEEELVISGWVESRKGSFVSMKGSITLPDGTIAVEGSGKLAIVNEAG